MKWSCESKPLGAALAAVRKACESKATLPILGCVLIEAKGSRITFTTTNLDLAVALTIPARVEQEGVITVSISRFASAVAKIGAEEVTITLEKEKLVCAGGEWEVKLLTLPASEFPPMPEVGAAVELAKMENGLLARGLAICAGFVSEDETRYVLNGILFTCDGERLLLVATDGRRLVTHTVGAPWPLAQFVLPSRSAAILGGLCEAGAVTLQNNGTTLFAEGESWRFTSKLIDGNFPNFSQVIPPPDAGKRRVTIGRKELLAALPFVEVVINPKSMAVRLDARKKELRITTNAPEIGESHVTIPATVEGGELSAGFNPIFLRDALGVFSSDELTLAMADGSSPLRIDADSTTIVLMPMSLEGRVQ